MTETNDQVQSNDIPAASDVPAAAEGQQDRRGGRAEGRGGDSRRGGGRGRDNRRGQERDSEWQERVVQIRRVSKTVKGGKKMSFRAIVVVGNEKGQVGVGVGKAGDVIGAVRKGVADGKKHLVKGAPNPSQFHPHPQQRPRRCRQRADPPGSARNRGDCGRLDPHGA